jgi:MFS family permease
MSIEMAASRLLTPYFGNSLYIWTNIIGVIMLALTIGYAWGGKIADKYTSERLLYIIILIAGGYITLVPWLARTTISLMLNLVTENPLSMFYTSFLSSLPLFVVPFACLGMVSPYIIRLSSHRVNSIGYIAGKVAAYSTFGSIIGTFIPVFLTIPFLGTQKTIWLFACLLIATATLGLAKLAWSGQSKFKEENYTSDKI